MYFHSETISQKWKDSADYKKKNWFTMTKLKTTWTKIQTFSCLNLQLRNATRRNRILPDYVSETNGKLLFRHFLELQEMLERIGNAKFFKIDFFPSIFTYSIMNSSVFFLRMALLPLLIKKIQRGLASEVQEAQRLTIILSKKKNWFARICRQPLLILGPFFRSLAILVLKPRVRTSFQEEFDDILEAPASGRV